MKKKIADLLRKWADKLNPDGGIFKDPTIPHGIPQISIARYDLELLQYARTIRKFGMPTDIEAIDKEELRYAYLEIADKISKALLERDIIEFDIRNNHLGDVVITGEVRVGIKRL